MQSDYEKFAAYVDARGLGAPAPAPAPLSMNNFIRGAAGRPAPVGVTPKPAASVNGGEGTGTATTRKIGMNDFMRAAAFGTPL